MHYLQKIFQWLAAEAREKLDLAATWREIRSLGHKYGRRFVVAAILWELVEDVLFPYLSWRAGHPWLIPVFLVLHFEPVVYPIFLFVFRTWDRLRGREPWEPDRFGQSTFWRAGLQVLTYRVPALLMFFLLLSHLNVSTGLLAAYTVGMSVFGFVHDRIWHDSNFGIHVTTDTVQLKRVVAKTLTYRLVSVLIMASLFFGLLGAVPLEMWGYQTGACLLHFVLNLSWSRSSVGIEPVHRSTP